MDFKSIINKLNDIWIKFQVKFLIHPWSKIRLYKNYKLGSEAIIEPIEVTSNNIRQIVSDVYFHFEYKSDDFTKLFEAWESPLYMNYSYQQAKKNNNKFYGDCEDYAATLYNILNNNEYEVYILSLIVTPVKNNHAVMLIKNSNGTYTIINYNSIKVYYELKDYINNYTYKVKSYYISKFNYDKNRWEMICTNYDMR